ncbi:hypothetical protein GQ54DRAFT_264717 [Martensiomyces pterosporus]|nr:hypothetical protein GQ54DRAFT_264717 [Martensiomyces pterosporus]
MLVGYAPGFKDLGSIDISKYTHINLAYAVPSPNGTFSFDSSYNVSEFVDKIHMAGTKALISLGGWAASMHFSDILKSASDRSRMVGGILEYIKANGLDGVNVDWEFPGRLGDKCNRVDADNDAANLLDFTRQLRQSLDSAFVGSRKLIALAVGVQPFAGPRGPLADVTQYAQGVDYINILAYDINGNWLPSTGPNAPLNFEPNKGVQSSFESAIDSWVKAGFPASQIVVGIAFYGRSATANVDMSLESWNQYQPQETTAPRGDGDDGLWADPCAGGPAAFSGVWSYRNLRAQGLLKTADTAAWPWSRYWDNVAQVPWLFNANTKTFISYDDPQSVAAKMRYVQEAGLAGVVVWDVAMDYNDELLNAILSAGGTAAAPPSSIQVSSSGTQQTTQQSPASSSPTLPSSDTFGWPSSTAQPATTAASHGAPAVGGACGSQVVYKCMGASGKDAQFVVCASGAWVLQECGSGTRCVQNEQNIYCDWPN